MENVVEVKNLVKTYGKVNAVDNIDFSIAEQEIIALVGMNGAGKTTLLKMLSGLSNATSGSIKLFGMECDANSNRQVFAKVGALIENPGILPHMTGYENVRAKCMCTGHDKKEYIMELLRVVGLENAANKKVKGYSLGMKQRLGIAFALVGDPQLLILDEPINGLDPQGIVDIRKMILNLKERGITIIISSHILGELTKVATNYIFISEGKVVKCIDNAELVKNCEDAKIGFEEYYFEVLGGIR